MSARPANALRLCGFTPPRLRASRGLTLVLAMLFLGLAMGGGRFFAVGSAAAADAAVGAGAWLAQEVRGTVLVRAAGEAATGWQPLQAATPIAGQSEIATGSDGIAVLDNGVDQIRLAPNSRLVLPPDEDEGLLTIIEQSLGKIFFSVGHRPDRSFEVDAPYLVVLVKGTRFTVNATYLGNSVEVSDGTVEVKTVAGGNATGTLIGAGQTASVRAGNGSLEVESSATPDGDRPGQGTGDGEPQSSLPQVRKATPPDGGGGEDGGEGSGGSDGGSGQGGEDGDPGAGGGGDPDPDPGPGEGDGDGDGDGGHGCGSGHGHGGRHARESRV
jgi:hypothetical protein